MIHRLPITETLRTHVKSIITMMLKLLKTDNEENVLISLRIIIELHKHFRPSYNPEVSIQMSKIIYYNLGSNKFIKIARLSFYNLFPKYTINDLSFYKIFRFSCF